MFISESIATRTIRDFLSGENPFCDADHVISKIMNVFEDLELGMRLGHTHGERILAWRGVLKLFMQGHDMEALVEAEKLCTA